MSSWVKTQNAEWESMFEELQTYKENTGHCNVPAKYRENKALGTWVVKQRNFYKRFQINRRDPSANITRDRIARLEGAGFDWDPKETKWKLHFEALQLYKDEAGTLDVPKGVPPPLQQMPTGMPALSPVGRGWLDALITYRIHTVLRLCVTDVIPGRIPCSGGNGRRRRWRPRRVQSRPGSCRRRQGPETG